MANLIRIAGVQVEDTAGVRDRRIFQYTGPASYVAGGDSLVPAEVKLSQIDFISFENPVDGTPACRHVTYDHANGNVIWFDNAGAEIAAGVDLSTFSARAEFLGK